VISPTPWGGRALEEAGYAQIEMSSRRTLLLDCAIALAVLGLSLAISAGIEGNRDDGETAVTASGVLLLALSSLPLAARRFAPLGVFIFTALASSVLNATTEAAPPPIGPTLALYWLAAGSGGIRSRQRLIQVIAAVLLGVHAAAAGIGQGGFPGEEILWGILVWGGAWLAGDRTRLSHERMAELEERALRAEREAERERRLAAAEERGRIARDLHDSAGHAINVIMVQAGAGRLRKDADPEARETFETIEQVARETVGEIDQMVAALREDSARDEVEPPPGLAALEALTERHRAAGLEVTTKVRGESRPLPARVDRAAYRILQEALTNAARHGDGTAEVELGFDSGALELRVTNGIGRVRAPRPASGGHGLVGMRERAALLHGSVDTRAQNGRFEVHARLPLRS
jgi:signal transduction histidine kinase